MELYDQLAAAMLQDRAGEFARLLFDNETRFRGIIGGMIRKSGVRGIEPDAVFNELYIRLIRRFARERELFGEFLNRKPHYDPAKGIRNKIARRLETIISDMRQDVPRNSPETGAIDREAPPDPRADADVAAYQQMLASLATLPVKHRVVIKLRFLQAHRDLPKPLALAADERAWRPPVDRHPNSRTAGDAVDALTKLLADHENPVDLSDGMIAEALGLAGSKTQAQNTLASWKTAAKEAARGKIG